jgi:predicted SAM-dependent methyltransferase
VLRPGGRLRVLVPDVFAALSALEYQEDDWPGFAVITEPWSLDRKACHYITWGGQNRTVFTDRTLVDLMQRHGLTPSADWWTGHAAEMRDSDHDWEWLRALDSRLGESLVMEFVKA